VTVTESGGDGKWWGFSEKKCAGVVGKVEVGRGRQPPTWNQSCQGVARPRHLPRGLLRGRAAFTEGERCTGGLLGCGALVLVGLRGASTIGLAFMALPFSYARVREAALKWGVRWGMEWQCAGETLGFLRVSWQRLAEGVSSSPRHPASADASAPPGPAGSS
jgi:hypothetical protein